VREAGGPDVLGNVARQIGGRTVNLGGVLAGEGTATVARVAAVGVDDDLASGQAAVTVGAADHEAAGGVDVELGLLVDPLGRKNLLDDLLQSAFADILVLDVCGVLGREHDGVDGVRLAVNVAEGELALGIRQQPGQNLLLAHFCLLLDEAVGVLDRGRHQCVGLVAGKAEHQALVAGALFFLVRRVNTLADVAALFADGIEYGAGVAVKVLAAVVVADVTHYLADDFLVVDGGGSRDLAGNHDHAGLDEGFHGNAGFR